MVCERQVGISDHSTRNSPRKRLSFTATLQRGLRNKLKEKKHFLLISARGSDTETFVINKDDDRQPVLRDVLSCVASGDHPNSMGEKPWITKVPGPRVLTGQKERWGNCEAMRRERRAFILADALLPAGKQEF